MTKFKVGDVVVIKPHTTILWKSFNPNSEHYELPTPHTTHPELDIWNDNELDHWTSDLILFIVEYPDGVQKASMGYYTQHTYQVVSKDGVFTTETSSKVLDIKYASGYSHDLSFVKNWCYASDIKLDDVV